MQGIAGNKVSTGTQLLDTANAFLVQILPFLVCHRVDDAFLIIHKCQVFHLFFSFRLASSSSFCRCFSRPSVSAKGPSITMGSPLLNSMRAPNSLGLRPLPSTQTPALIKASL